MKKLILAALLMGLVGGGAILAFQQSIYGSLWGLKRALEAKDLQETERYVDLGEWVQVGFDFGAARAQAGATHTAGPLAGTLLGGLAKAMEAPLQKLADDPRLMEKLREKIADGSLLHGFGPFRPHRGLSALHRVEVSGREATVSLAGICEGKEATADLRFQRVPGPLGVAFWGIWQSVGMERDAIERLAQTCAQPQNDAPTTTPATGLQPN